MYHAMMPPPDDMNYCRYVTDQTKSTNAMEQDTVLNNIFHVDSVNVAVERRINIREIAIGMFKEECIQEYITWLMLATNRPLRLPDAFLPTNRNTLSAWLC